MKPKELIEQIEEGCGNLMGFPGDSPRIRCGNKGFSSPKLMHRALII